MAFLPYSIRNDDGIEIQYHVENKNVNNDGVVTARVAFDLDEVESSGILNDTSSTVQTIDYNELVKESAFIGDYPFDVIIEGLEEQFSDYLHLEDDNTDYVDVFYDQLQASLDAIDQDEEEEHPEEKREVLMDLQNKFIDKVSELFNRRLTITFMPIEEDTRNYEDIEYAIRIAYRFFIHGARNNFKNVISAEVYPKVKDIVDDKEYFDMVNDLVDSYSPLITSIGPEEFVNYTKDEEIKQLFDDGIIIGNFLRKYSPKLHENESLKIDIVNNITAYNQFQQMINGVGEENNI